MKWRTHIERPRTTEPTTALIAAKDPEGELYLAGIYFWRDGQWRCEETFKTLQGEFWWVYENELLQNLQAAMAGL